MADNVLTPEMLEDVLAVLAAAERSGDRVTETDLRACLRGSWHRVPCYAPTLPRRWSLGNWRWEALLAELREAGFTVTRTGRVAGGGEVTVIAL